jgi:hypothetical protein
MLTMEQMLEKHFDEVTGNVLFHVKPGDCHICGKHDELRCGVCFDCKDRVRISNDLITCFDVRNPGNTWPFRYR